MSIDISGIGNRAGIEKEFCYEHSLGEYLDSATRLLAYHIRLICPALARPIMSNDDLITNIATEIMLAEQKWDGVSCTKKYYLNQRVSWALKSFLKRMKRESLKNTFSMDSLFGDNGVDMSYFACGSQSHQAGIENKESVEKILSSSPLTEKQNLYIRKHYLSEMSFSEIAREREVSRESVRQTVNRGMKRIRESIPKQ